MPTTPAADAGLAEAARLAGDQPVGSHHLLLAALADPDSAAARTLTALGVNLGEAREALRNAQVSGTSDEAPEERGRRQMTVRVTDGGLMLEVTDPALAALARAAAEALGDRVPEPGSIPGDLPTSDSLAQVWLALRDSLEDIRERAATGSGGGQQEGGPQEGSPQEGGPEKGRPAA
jgi:ATP-dependent Clp protease ATP-binding subunit ClpC